MKTLSSLRFPKQLERRWQTGLPIDSLLSEEGGLYAATSLMLSGGPGSGKTTLACDMLAGIRHHEEAGAPKWTRLPRVLLVSAEMTEADWALYVRRHPEWGPIPVWLADDAAGASLWGRLSAELEQGYDVVAVDSLQELFLLFKDELGLSLPRVQTLFFSLLRNHMDGANRRRKLTSFILLQQTTKARRLTFAGSNRILHFVSAHAELHVDWDANPRRRFLRLTKNRRGPCGELPLTDPPAR